MSRSGALQVLWVVCKVPGSFQGCSCLVKEGLRQVQVLLPVGTIGVRIYHGPGRKRVIVLQQNLRVTGVGWIAFQVYRWNILPFYWLLSWQMRHEASCKNSYSVQHRMSSHGHGACRHTERLRNRAMRGPTLCTTRSSCVGDGMASKKQAQALYSSAAAAKSSASYAFLAGVTQVTPKYLGGLSLQKLSFRS